MTASSTLRQSPNKRQSSNKSLISLPEFQIINASLVLSIPPVFAANPRAGAEEMLDSTVMRYSPALKGVLLSHANLRFADKVATIQADCPFLVCTVIFDATVWSPHVALNLSGKISLCSPDHISLLVHRTFNVSIPRHHIPIDTWEFEYGPAENDPEYGQDAVSSEDRPEIEHTTGGKWVHRVTGEMLGGENGTLEFTVIGLTVANEMLSLLGSLQPDPFSPLHTVRHDNIAAEKEEQEDERESDPDSSEEEEEEEDDRLQTLGKRKAVDVLSEKTKRVK